MHVLTSVLFPTLIVVCAASVVEDSMQQETRHKFDFFEPLDYDRLDLFAPVSSSVESELCRNHSSQFLSAVRDNQLWALRMLDSSTKAGEGVWFGCVQQLGNYDGCLSVRDVPSSAGSFSGKFCLASFGSRNDFSPLLERYAMSEHFMYNFSKRVESLAADGTIALVANVGATAAVCIPSSCTSRDLERHLRNELRSTQLSVRVDSLDCSSSEDSIEFQTSDWCAVALVSFIGAITVLSTAYDLLYNKTEFEDGLVTAFSLYSNGRKLLRVTSSSGDNIASLHGVRVLSLMWVVMFHNALMGSITPIVNLTKLQANFDKVELLPVTYGTLCVESFFLLSGLLVCYNFMKDREKRVEFNLLKFYLHRYIRLTPSFAMMILLVSTLVYYTGDGPWWKASMYAQRYSCEQYWFSGLLYISNYYPGHSMCNVETWYLSVDMQLFWLSPLILFPLWRNPKLGVTLWVTILVAGLAVAYAIPYINMYAVYYDPQQRSQMYRLYLPTHGRFTPWLIGVGLGYLLHRTKSQPLHLSRHVVVGGWLLAVLCTTASFLPAAYFFQTDYVYERFLASAFIAFSRPGFTLGVALVIFLCARGYGGAINTFLSCRAMQVISRLTYTIYLTHCICLRHLYSTTKTTMYYGYRQMIMSYIDILLVSSVFAVVLHLTVEAPTTNIERIFLNRKSRGEKRKSSDLGIVDPIPVQTQDQIPNSFRDLKPL